MNLNCAIYTRKSSEEGLEQSFNSLDAQREACQAFIQSQKGLGWKAIRAEYDDGGFSGGNMHRPALQRLLADIASKRIQVVVVYKVDRLTRSLADFAKLVELFDAHGVSFVSVTQQFNTTTSMGRLTLNVLLSFAQFEREVTGERIRDKIAASKRKGLWMGGIPPIGYVPKDRTLVIDEAQAERVRGIFRLYVDLGDVTALKRALDDRGWRTPPRQTRRAGQAGDRPFSRGHLYRILGNVIYRGQIAHRGVAYPGEHPALIADDLWNAAQAQLASNRNGERKAATAMPSMLAGLAFDANEHRLTPTHAKKGSRRYRYYTSPAKQDPLRVPAQELDEIVVRELKACLSDGLALQPLGDDDAGQLRTVMANAKRLIEALASANQRIQSDAVRSLLARVVVGEAAIAITIRGDALGAPDRTLHREAPITHRLCGRTMRLISTSAEPARRVADPKLLALLSRSQDWFTRLATGQAASLEAIAKAEQVTSSWIARVIHLAFLAPDITQAIVDGRQPPELTAERLMRLVPVPMAWDAQRAHLGF